MYVLASSFALSWIFTIIVTGIVILYATENEPKDIYDEEN